MALLDFPLHEPTNPSLVHEEVYLRHPGREDFDQWAALREASKAHLQPFEPLWIEGELSRPNFRKRLRAYARDIRAGISMPYFIFRAEDDQLVGGCTLSNIRRRAAMTGTIGYWVGEKFTRRGYCLSAVMAVAHHAFTTMHLLRLEAACLPENKASQHLLLKAGFQKEGYARHYLNINGRRQDHVLFGLSAQDFNQQ